MPRYYFDVEGAPGSFRDDVRQTLPDAEAAREEAVAVLTTLAGSVMGGRGDHRVTVRVRGSDDLAVFESTLSLATSWSPRE